MAQKFFVPKFITIEDKLAGIVTFRQLFALLIAFFLTFFAFRSNPILGIVTGLLSFTLAIVLTFLSINGKPVIYNLPKIFNYIMGPKKYTWKKIEKFSYKSVELSSEINIDAPIKTIKKRQKEFPKKADIVFEYPEINIKEKVSISFEKPIAEQAENFENETSDHRHLPNPRNPYRLFPYIKFYKLIDKK